MKKIIDFINERHNFIIKGHTKNQRRYDIYQYIELGTANNHKYHYVVLTKVNQIKDFFEYCKTHDIKKYTLFNAEEIVNNNNCLAIWPRKNGNIEMTAMPNEYLYDKKIYAKVGSINNFDDISVSYWQKHNFILSF